MRGAWKPIVCLAIVGSAVARAEPQTSETNTRLLAPIQYEQLTIIPIVASGETPDTSKYLTLKEGLARKLVAVEELPGGAEVNTVLVHNRSDHPLLLIGGEIILGGQQDRIIGDSTIVAAHAKENVSVYCVEHGRWQGAGAFSSIGGVVDEKVRLQAQVNNDQEAVWAEVAARSKALDAKTETGTYRAVAVGERGNAAAKPYREHFEQALAVLPEKKKIIGLAAAVNGRITAVERFASPDLFARYRDDLLSSMILSAVDVPVDAAAAPPTSSAVAAFMGSTAKAKKNVRREGAARQERALAPAAVQTTVIDQAGNRAAVYDSMFAR